MRYGKTLKLHKRATAVLLLSLIFACFLNGCGAAELLEGADMYGMNVELLRSSFSMTENEWLPGNGW